MDRSAEITIYWSDEDECFIAYAPELPGCMAHGDSYAEAAKSMQEAMDGWIEVAIEIGKEIPDWAMKRVKPAAR